jgi:short-subunit dehydrogenase
MTTLPFSYARETTLITGASRGIGAAFARELARRGAPDIALVARTEHDLESLASELRDLYQTRVHVIVADLADADAPAAIKAETDRLGLEVGLLINNAGFGDYGRFDQRPLSKQESMIAVNVSSLVALTHLYLPEMAGRGEAGIINVGSTAGFQPIPYMATYAATKAFVQSFSEALWAENEERGTDVRVVCLCPGGTATEFGSVAADGRDVGRGSFEHAPQSTAEEVVQAGLDALDRNACYEVVGTLNYLGTLGPRLLPRSAIARLAAALFRRVDEEQNAERATRRRLYVAGAAVAASIAAVTLMAKRRPRGP